ncbi:DNA starvation/stationary phase protection protein [Cryomorphaceae bacterium]|nr:DNA starvation/stationary phase protection protein [Cryomorphaceae bacterium]
MNTSTSNRLGFNSEESNAIIGGLNAVLANYQMHYQKLRNFHWNVVGDDFFDLHENFEVYYTKAVEHIDEIAERIRIFGGTPLSNFSDYLEHASIAEASPNTESREMASEILADFEEMLGYFVEATEIAANNGDTGTVTLLQEYTKDMEKDHWMLRSWLGK